MSHAPASCNARTGQWHLRGDKHDSLGTIVVLSGYVSVMTLIGKEQALIAWLTKRRRVAIGFSGGVDSAYLAAVTLEALGRDHSLAIIGRSESLAGREEDHAAVVARAIGIPIYQVDTGELSDPRYAANPSNRCYFCKSVLWDTLRPIATQRGFETLVDGTNADDLHDFRPGAKAATEQGVESPLAAVGLTKPEIRQLTKERGWPWWDRPAAPCLASRLPHGTAVTAERLRQVDVAESGIRDLGVKGNLRVRHYGELAKVEMDLDILPRWREGAAFAALEAAVRAAGFTRLELDARGFRSGSLNVLDGGAALPGH
ncbi:MAG TPA: ATP-dependent sacrificial sulfur transferase LarE [Gemmatimonadaceae bacterium]|nr:ATP-dependent sacrificial sulfur transferase LarE [Gemmatimonadaceae bacterium]